MRTPSSCVSRREWKGLWRARQSLRQRCVLGAPVHETLLRHWHAFSQTSPCTCSRKTWTARRPPRKRPVEKIPYLSCYQPNETKQWDTNWSGVDGMVWPTPLEQNRRLWRDRFVHETFSTHHRTVDWWWKTRAKNPRLWAEWTWAFSNSPLVFKRTIAHVSITQRGIVFLTRCVKNVQYTHHVVDFALFAIRIL